MLTASLAEATLYENCKSDGVPWSVITSSGSNATLAAVLAGFMMTAAVVLLGRQPSGSETALQADGGKSGHALGLFAAGIFALALDSWLFGNINALAPVLEKPSQGHDYVGANMRNACAIAWTELMPAASMLVVGGSLMIAGLAWILCQYFVNNNITQKYIMWGPAFLIGWTLVILCLLGWRIAFLYIKVMKEQFGVDSNMTFVGDHAYLLAGVYLVVVISIITGRTWLLSRKQSDAISQVNPDLKQLAAVFFLTVILAGFASVFAGFISDESGFVNSSGHLPTTGQVDTAVLIALSPTLVWLFVAWSVPAKGGTSNLLEKLLALWSKPAAKAIPQPPVVPIPAVSPTP